MDLSLPDLTESKSMVSVDYRLPGQWNIPLGTDETRVMIRSWDIPVNYVYNAYPRYFHEPFLSARPIDPVQMEIIPAPCKVFFEGAYIGKFMLNRPFLSNGLEFSLGTDPMIRIEKEILKKSQSGSIVASREKHTREYCITVINLKTESVSITVQDQIPVSGADDISVEALELSGGSLEKDSGIITWTVNAAPGEKKTLTVKYQVAFPKGRKLDSEI